MSSFFSEKNLGGFLKHAMSTMESKIDKVLDINEDSSSDAEKNAYTHLKQQLPTASLPPLPPLPSTQGNKIRSSTLMGVNSSKGREAFSTETSPKLAQVVSLDGAKTQEQVVQENVDKSVHVEKVSFISTKSLSTSGNDTVLYFSSEQSSLREVR
jgi:hypothetical protein